MTRTSRVVVLIGGLSRLEFSLRATALMLAAVSSGGDAVVTALIGAGAVIPTVFMSPIVVRVIDRFRITGSVLCGVGINVILYVTFIVFSNVVDTSWVYCLYALAFGMARPFIDNAVNILIAETSSADEVERTNGFLSTVQSLGGVVGPSLSGTLFVVSSIAPFVAAIAVAFGSLGCACYVFGLSDVSDVNQSQPSIHSSSLSLLLGNRMVVGLSVAGFLSNVFAGCYAAVVPLYLLNIAHMSPRLYGLNSSIISVGIVFANVVFIGIVPHMRSWKIAVFAGMFSGLAMVGISSSRLSAVLLACACVYGVGLGGWNSGTSSALLSSARGPGLHRVATLYRSIVFAGSPLGSGLGALRGSFSPALGVFVAGVGTCACSLVLRVAGGGVRNEAYSRTPTEVG